jgi:imidazoleglycerol-phosphate dehydratase
MNAPMKPPVNPSEAPVNPPRSAKVSRKTSETSIELVLSIDGRGQADIDTGIGFLDHMLISLARHARFDLTLHCEGDLAVDDHHTAEDCALALGQALDHALGDRRGIQRFAHAYAPLDEALARVVIDLSGRPSAVVALDLKREFIGELATENIGHVFTSLAMASRSSLHVDVLRGENDHHRAEAAFKAAALALRQAVMRDGTDAVPSTKGVL